MKLECETCGIEHADGYTRVCGKCYQAAWRVKEKAYRAMLAEPLVFRNWWEEDVKKDD